jgi:hypothetical protein
MWSDRSHKSYRPVTTLTFRFNHIIHGLHPLGYHAVNVLLHAAVSVLVFAFVLRTFFPQSPGVSVCVRLGSIYLSFHSCPLSLGPLVRTAVCRASHTH